MKSITMMLFALGISTALSETKIYELDQIGGVDMCYQYFAGTGYLDIDSTGEKLYVGYHRVDGRLKEYISSFRLDFSGLPDSVSKVTLMLYPLLRDLEFGAGRMYYFQEWTELPWPNRALTYLLLPNQNLKREIQLNYIPPAKTWRWYSVDITNYYQSKRLGETPNYGFSIERGYDIGQNVFASTEYHDPTKRPRLKIVTAPKSFKLSFPVAGLSPYTTRCVGVLDNDLVRGNKKVLSYNRKWATTNPHTYAPNIIGYTKPDRSKFDLPLIVNYDDEISNSGKEYLFYDGHSGYDYAENGKVEAGTIIRAAASGTLVVATTKTKPDGINVWRNILLKVPEVKKTLQWDDYHAFYILHQDGWSTWYLHASDFVAEIRSKILQSGYVNVNRGDPLAYVGKEGAGGYHLHFGLRKGDTLKDPYGNGSTIPPRWEETPP